MSSSSQSSEAAPGRSVKLRRDAQENLDVGAVDGFRLRVTAYDAVDMDNEVFLYLRHPVSRITGRAADEFNSVCSSVDMAEYPVGEPVGTPPFFRLDTVDIVFRSVREVEDAWTVISGDVTRLVKSLNASERLSVAEEVTITG